jgi:glutamine synthetase
LLLAAGLRGIDEGLTLPPEAKGNLFGLDRRERLAAGIESLPLSLEEALGEMERSDLVRETLGDHIFEWFLRNKRSEWDDYQRQVTPFELTRYLPIW